jgi:tetratricopeptide (TPR) repeat protein
MGMNNGDDWEEDEMWERLGRWAEERALEAARERTVAVALRRELLAMPARDRGARVAREPRFASPALARELLESARAVLPNDPAAARVELGLALEVAGRIGADKQDLQRGLVAEILCERAEASRRLGRLAVADATLGAAARALPEVADPAAHSLYCRRLADLRADQQDLRSACGLLVRAARLSDDCGQVEERAAAAASLGSLLGRAAAERCEGDRDRRWNGTWGVRRL